MDILKLLADGEIHVEGRMPYSSNMTYRVQLISGDETIRAIYKPKDGERPLWDFPPGLHKRETAAYELSVAMGIPFVPPTIIRNGPFGEGSFQHYIDADHVEHYFTLFEKRPELHDRFREIAVFDFIANNTDRKSGHVLIDKQDGIWGIDQGLCFSAQFKLRTVIWEFGGEKIAEPLLEAIARIHDAPPPAIAALISDAELAAMVQRCEWVLERGVLPVDESGHRYPWPLV